jgi:hypothetical protein
MTVHTWRCRRVTTPRAWWRRKVRFARQVERIGWLSFYNLDGSFSNRVRWVRFGRRGPTLWWCSDMRHYDGFPHRALVGASVGNAYAAILRPMS